MWNSFRSEQREVRREAFRVEKYTEIPTHLKSFLEHLGYNFQSVPMTLRVPPPPCQLRVGFGNSAEIEKLNSFHLVKFRQSLCVICYIDRKR